MMRPTEGSGRRLFLRASLGAVGAVVLGAAWARLPASLDDIEIVQFDDNAVRTGKARVPKVVKPDAEWQKQLSPLAYAVARRGGTEYAFSGAYWNLHEKGVFRCVCCETALFSSQHKFDSGTGWPSFWQPIAEENVKGPRDPHRDQPDTEVKCSRCDAHLGDVFNDGPRPTGLRYCIDSVSLRFARSTA